MMNRTTEGLESVEVRSIQPPSIVLDELFELTGWLPEDAAAHRRFALDPDAARFFGWTLSQARSAPDSHYAEVIRRFHREWQEGIRYSLAIRHRVHGEAVGSVEIRPAGGMVDVSFMVQAEWRGRGLAPSALQAMLAWAKGELGVRRARLACRVDNGASRRVAQKCGFAFKGREGDELQFGLDLE
jgi:RimJ/RimL family protein N-acetyltransferase